MKKNVFVFDSPYCFLLYCILFPEKIDSTIYVHSDNAAIGILDFSNRRHHVIKKGVNRFSKFICYVYFKLQLIFDPALRQLIKNKKDYSFYGQDHLFFSTPFLNDFVLIEDGLANYRFPKYSKLYKLLLGDEPFGRSSAVKKVILTGMMEVTDPKILEKVEFINLSMRWKSLTSVQKNKINNVFSNDPAEHLNADVMILTQPLSEYGFISEIEKINIYKKIINTYSERKIVIRQHPRETTVYSDYFPEVEVNNSKAPVELLILNSPSVTTVVTLFSSGIFNMPCAEKIFIGTSFHPLLVEKFGLIEKCHLIDDCKGNS
ncbi:UNVERIFIED_ORG: hypothetical protein M2355_001366 [Lelliottia amnigena]|nr:hypothetical protein [Lelliottia amnigena]